jgi:hypothetical protein
MYECYSVLLSIALLCEIVYGDISNSDHEGFPFRLKGTEQCQPQCLSHATHAETGAIGK